MVVKDLGPQISWKAVFLAEYFGPILIHSLFVLFPTVFYGTAAASSGLHPIQRLCYALVLFHFGKREAETLFLHRFSHATMPLRNLFKNCAHYWGLSGVLLGYFLYRPGFVSSVSEDVVPLLVYAFVGAELANFYTHWVLSSLRPPGTTIRRIPYGFGFSSVSCPNYFFETLAWVFFSLLAEHWSAWLFTVVATAQMAVWAKKKHKAYLKEFKDYPKNRKAMFPFIF